MGMTNAEAKEHLKDILADVPNDKCIDWIEALNQAIKALEQQEPSDKNIIDPCDGCRYELNSTNGNPCYSCGKYKLTEQQPCEDCISRVEALKAIEKEKQGWEGAERYAIDECHTRIADLPSVTPTRPNGKWKRISPAGIYECTNCNQVIMTSDIDCYKFCHGCGVRMEGEE